MRASPLARTLLAAYLVLVAYASLHPFSGWRGHGLSPFGFLGAPWPRYLTGFDVAANVAAYFPLGFLAVLAAAPRLRGPGAAFPAVAGALAVSIGMEALQGYLPSRIPSVADVAFNGLGALLGAAVALAGSRWLLETGPLRRLREDLVAPGALPDAGLALLGLWLLAQLDPTTMLFGAGDLRGLLPLAPGPERLPEYFVAVEALIAGGNLIAVALLGAALLQPGAPARLAIAALLLVALAVRAAAHAILMRTDDAFAWLTSGATQGLAWGFALALVLVSLPRVAQLALAAMLLMAATVLVNLAPPNPYTAAMLKLWSQGHFLNFNGLTRLAAALWPFAAIAWAFALAARGPRGRVG